MDIGQAQDSDMTPVASSSLLWARLRPLGPFVFVAVYLAATAWVALSDLGVQSLVLVAAVFAILAISLDLAAGMLGLYSLGQGGFFAIGAYLTTIFATNYHWNVFAMLPIALAVSGLAGLAVGAMSLRVSGLYFAITTFIFTLVLTVLATDLVTITGGLQGLLGPAFPDFPPAWSFWERLWRGACRLRCSFAWGWRGACASRRSIRFCCRSATRSLTRKPRACRPRW